MDLWGVKECNYRKWNWSMQLISIVANCKKWRWLLKIQHKKLEDIWYHNKWEGPYRKGLLWCQNWRPFENLFETLLKKKVFGIMKLFCLGHKLGTMKNFNSRSVWKDCNNFKKKKVHMVDLVDFLQWWALWMKRINTQKF